MSAAKKIEGYFSDWKNKSDDQKHKCSIQIKQSIEADFKSISTENQIKLMQIVSEQTFNYLKSNDASERKAGLILTYHLIDLEVNDFGFKSLCVKDITANIPSMDILVMELNACIFIKLLQLNIITSEMFHHEIKKANICVSDEQGDRKLYSLILIRECTKSIPNLFYIYIKSFFFKICPYLLDNRVIIRDLTLSIIRNCMSIFVTRENRDTSCHNYYSSFYKTASIYFKYDPKSTAEDNILASLKGLNELVKICTFHSECFIKDTLNTYTIGKNKQTSINISLPSIIARPKLTCQYYFEGEYFDEDETDSILPLNSSICRKLVRENYNDIAQYLVRYITSRNNQISTFCVSLLAVLSEIDKSTFCQNHLSIYCKSLASVMAQSDNTQAVLLSLAVICHELQEQVMPYIDSILQTISLILPRKDKKSKDAPVDPMIMASLASLAKIVAGKPQAAIIGQYFADILSNSSLTPAVVTGLIRCYKNIPNSQSLIKDLVNIILVRTLKVNIQASFISQSNLNIVTKCENESQVILAIKTLRSFDMPDYITTNNFYQASQCYLISSNPAIRLEAANSCCKIISLLPSFLNISSIPSQNSEPDQFQRNIIDSLKQLITVGVSDSDDMVRWSIMNSLSQADLFHLSHFEILKIMSLGLKDTNFQTRECVIEILGRLCVLNPAVINPILSKCLIECLIELKSNGSSPKAVFPLRILSSLVRSSPSIAISCVGFIKTYVLQLLSESNLSNEYISILLALISDLAFHCGYQLQPCVTLILTNIQTILMRNTSTIIKECCINCMAYIMQYTGYFVQNHQEYISMFNVLMKLIKSEQKKSTRRLLLNAIGCLGARDSYQFQFKVMDYVKAEENSCSLEPDIKSWKKQFNQLNICEILQIHANSNNLDDFYFGVCINIILQIIAAPSHSLYHSMAIQAIHDICAEIRGKCYQYFPQIFPVYIDAIRTRNAEMKTIFLQQLRNLLSMAKNKAEDYVDEVFSIIAEIWVDSAPFTLQSTILKVVESIQVSTPEKASVKIAGIIPKMMTILLNDRNEISNASEDDQLTSLLLSAIQRMSSYLKDYMFLIVPSIVRCFSMSNKPLPIKVLAMNTLQKLFLSNNLIDYISQVISALLKVLDSGPMLHKEIISMLCTLLEHVPVYMKTFILPIKQALLRNKLSNFQLESLMNLVEKSPYHVLEQESYYNKSQAINSLLQQRQEDTSSPTTSPHTINIENLSRSLQCDQLVSREDYTDWLNRFTIEMIGESPSPIIRHCHLISKSCSIVGQALFNFAFFSFWRELNYETKEKLSNSFNEVMQLLDKNDVGQTILNLVEFLERIPGNQLILDNKTLASFAFKSSAIVKALRFTEESFRIDQNIDMLQSLISINTALNDHDAAEGVLVYAIKQNLVDLKLQQQWYENLHDWTSALGKYDEKLQQNPQDNDLLMGKMRCLESLCEWKELDEMVERNSSTISEIHRVDIARMGSYSSLGLSKWDSLKNYATCIPKQNFDGSLFRAIYNIQDNLLVKGKKYLDLARDILDYEVSTLLTESYNRGYKSLVLCQMLTELEEVINYKLFPSQRVIIRENWKLRIKYCKRIVDDWQRILDVRSLVLDPSENIETWLRFISICRKVGRYSLCHNAFHKLLNHQQISEFEQNIVPDLDISLSFSYIKYMWATKRQPLASSLLTIFTSKIVNIVKQLPDRSVDEEQEKFLKKMLAKSYLQLSHWSCVEVLRRFNVKLAKQYYLESIKYSPDWYKSWHSWAKFNYEMVLNYKQTNIVPPLLSSVSGETSYAEQTIASTNKDIESKIIELYVIPGIEAFFRAIKLSEKHCFQDILRLLTLWFEFGENELVYDVIQKEMKDIIVVNWLQVIPQLIARIDTSKQKVRHSIQQLLIKFSFDHAQAVIYPLLVSAKSVNNVRSAAVKKIFISVSEKHPNLVEEASMISRELIRVSILWGEEWYSDIEEASRMFFNDKNVPATLALLDALHHKINAGAETPYEIAFLQNYETELNEALKYRNLYAISADLKELMQAWRIYYRLFKKLTKQVNQISSFSLVDASPKLLNCCDTMLAIPGTYRPNCQPVYIQSIHPILQVIGSKQKPRKLAFRGSDGKKYEFLLKSHEDLRQDERVMQLFGLLNNILSNNYETFKRNLEIKKYSVTPISTDSGLIEWVPECDTLYSLIKDYRNKNSIQLTSERSMLTKYSPVYDQLDMVHKMELFEIVLDSTGDNDLADSMWFKSINSECWYDRRTNFTRSLAVMSMVGYMLGLGDRHPLNIMSERTTGKIIHIDFGDCFEVAMTRDKFAEKVPFRLTRMLTKSMGVTGIEGAFKITCIRVMEVLRENKDSLLAVLEAFIYDPLLSWRLLEAKEPIRIASTGSMMMQFRRISTTHASSSSAPQQVSNTGEDQIYKKNIKPEILNKKAISVINRVKDKLSGKDFKRNIVVDVKTQVELLIEQATCIENLAPSYFGWCPYW